MALYVCEARARVARPVPVNSRGGKPQPYSGSDRLPAPQLGTQLNDGTATHQTAGHATKHDTVTHAGRPDTRPNTVLSRPAHCRVDSVSSPRTAEHGAFTHPWAGRLIVPRIWHAIEHGTATLLNGSGMQSNRPLNPAHNGPSHVTEPARCRGPRDFPPLPNR